ncbi:hypothetical protein K1719_005778 [Acacia pycnantha]|nr:hypothetical protein K1719_005778 [Acacia pycnantha]
MDFEMETSPSYFDPQDLNVRDQFRRYRKRHSTSGTSTLPANSASKSFKAGLLCDVSVQYLFCTKMLALDTCYRHIGDGAETIYTLFASLLDSSLQGLMSFPDLILEFEKKCRSVSESIGYGLNKRHRVVEDKLMRQNAQLLLDQAATGSLLWFTATIAISSGETHPHNNISSRTIQSLQNSFNFFSLQILVDQGRRIHLWLSLPLRPFHEQSTLALGCL